MSAALGLVSMTLACFLGRVYGNLGDACPGTTCDSGNHEICDTGNTDSCICDAGYTAGTSDATTCFQDCPADPGFAHGTQTGDLHFEGTASITCDPGYTAGAGGGGGSITCQNDGTWDTTGAVACTAVDCSTTISDANGAHSGDSTYGGTASINCNVGYTGGGSIICKADGSWDEAGATTCAIVDCGPATIQAGYSAAAGATIYQSSRTVTCDTGNGYTGSPPAITCEASGSWTVYSGCNKATDLHSVCGDNIDCTMGNGGAGAICSTNCVCDTGNGYTEDSSTCKKDCGNRPSEDGYVPEASPASTLQGATVSVTCAEGYTGTAAQITCEASGSWSTYSGCSGGNRTKLDFSLIIVLAVLMLVLI